jgi:hypothetical protein
MDLVSCRYRAYRLDAGRLSGKVLGSWIHWRGGLARWPRYGPDVPLGACRIREAVHRTLAESPHPLCSDSVPCCGKPRGRLHGSLQHRRTRGGLYTYLLGKFPGRFELLDLRGYRALAFASGLGQAPAAQMECAVARGLRNYPRRAALERWRLRRRMRFCVRSVSRIADFVSGATQRAHAREQKR